MASEKTGVLQFSSFYDLLAQHSWTLGLQGAVFSGSLSDIFLLGLASSRYSKYFWGFSPFALTVSSREYAIRPVTVGRRNWLFSDTSDGAAANALYLTMVEMAKVYGLNLYEYLKYLLEHRPSKDISDEELSKFAPWSETVKKLCKNKAE